MPITRFNKPCVTIIIIIIIIIIMMIDDNDNDNKNKIKNRTPPQRNYKSLNRTFTTSVYFSSLLVF